MLVSQKVRVTRVRVKGAKPYMGDTPDGTPRYADTPGDVMEWLCDAWRSRYNQLRSKRNKYAKDGSLIPIGQTVTDLTDAQARQACPWLAAVPDPILHSTEKTESKEWGAAIKRRKTFKAKHHYAGRMPRFRSRKHSPQSFKCISHNGRNAKYRQVNRNQGIVTINGQNPIGHRDGGFKWTLEIHVRISQPIRPYTSVIVNWTERTLVFVNTPQPLGAAITGRNVGIDRGSTHQMALSDGRFIDLPQRKLERIDKEIRRRQKSQVRKAKAAGYDNMRDYRKAGASNRYRREQAKIRSLHAKAKRIRYDWAQQETTRLVREYDLIAVEQLNLTGMTRKGGNRKRRLNHDMRASVLGLLIELLVYKTRLVDGKELEPVPAPYTSQTCSKCGYCAKENRESQADFQCGHCGYKANADLNAAVNILGLATGKHTRGLRVTDVKRCKTWESESETRAAVAREPHPDSDNPGGIPRL